ncbi:MAG: holo-ACP synthase [Candidatus Omnitrophota bacterium]|nr:holo-ACP synthase [Candidatus Omnitrophota bacterium]MBU1928405.1 holo-ACP synthase [Candidatus Omnitrophota bacterium]MBU2034726.1 holo-ACP synthase [Candidatus Omnitrophota bacterium]
MIIGTGVDITEVSRLKQAVNKWGGSFLNRVFTDKELANAKTHVNFFQHLAGRFAAKEAVFKALGQADLLWKDVQILNDAQGKPYCSILNDKAKNKDIHISISHVKSYAVANAIVAKKS